MFYYVLVFLALVCNSSIYASNLRALAILNLMEDFMSFTHFAIVVFPFIIPLFFLRGEQNKIKMYLMLTIIPFGVLGILQSFWTIIIYFIGWENNLMLILSQIFYFFNLVGLGFSIWLLFKFKKLIQNVKPLISTNI